MNFRSPAKSNEYIGSTKKGSIIKYRWIREDRIVFLNKETRNETFLEMPNTQFFEKQSEATKITLKCNFVISPLMADLLEKSKIVEVDSFSNDGNHQIVIIPLPLFEYLKLNEVLYDLFEKFDL